MSPRPKSPLSKAERVKIWRDGNRNQVNASAASRRDALAAAGKCVQCGRKNRNPDLRRCPKCAAAARLAAQASRDRQAASA